MNAANCHIALTALLLLAPSALAAQEAQSTPATAKAAEVDTKNLPTYILGPEDKLTIYVRDVPEITGRVFMIDNRGIINLPLVGQVKAGGTSVEDLEAELKDKLSKYLREPDATISITEFRSSPVYVFGSVQKPGVVQLLGPRTLVEVLSSAGGIAAEASNSVFVTRRLEYGEIPVPSAVTDPNEEYSIAEIVLQDVIQARRPSENIVIRPFDVISVPKRETIYVSGDVRAPGAFPPKERGNLSVLEAVSLAGGFNPTARPQQARIMRPILSGPQRYEIPINAREIAAGRAPDLFLQPGDVLVIPGVDASKRTVWTAVLDRTLTIGMNALMWAALWHIQRRP